MRPKRLICILKNKKMRYKLTIEYDGTDLLGWQRQLDGPSVQEYLETAISLFMGIPPLSREEYALMKTENNREKPQLSVKTRFYPVQCAGRTDSGVHALAQVAHVDIEKDIDEFRLLQGLNHHLRTNKMPVSILNVEKVSEDFHARFSAVGRGYIYRILNRRSFPVLENNRVWWVPYPLDIEKMRQGAAYLLGHHDFSSFRAVACQAKSPIKTLDKFEIIKDGEEIRFIVEARSFLHHQVRNMVGTLKMVGDGHLSPEAVKTILEARDRRAAGPTAPASGLYLSKVIY